MLNVSAPGTFEEHMPGIAQWFRDRSPTTLASERVQADYEGLA